MSFLNNLSKEFNASVPHGIILSIVIPHTTCMTLLVVWSSEFGLTNMSCLSTLRLTYLLSISINVRVYCFKVLKLISLVRILI